MVVDVQISCTGVQKLRIKYAFPLNKTLVKMMIEYKREIIFAVILAVVTIVAIGGASYYLTSISKPSPTPTLAPTPAPTPTSTTSPAIPPKVPSLPFEFESNLTSSVGFNVTRGDLMGFEAYLLVLSPGGSGSVPYVLTSYSGEDVNVSLSVKVDPVFFQGAAATMEGIKLSFSPSTLILTAGEMRDVILEVEVEPNATTGLFIVDTCAVGESFTYGAGGFHLLVSSYVPSYTFWVYEARGEPPQPSPTPAPTPSPTATSAPTPTYFPSEIPSIGLRIGGEVYVMFIVETYSGEQTMPIKVNISYNSGPLGALPRGMSVEFLSDPLDVVSGVRDRMFIMSLKTNSDAPEGTYKMFVTGSVGSLNFERTFYLTVAAHE